MAGTRVTKHDAKGDEAWFDALVERLSPALFRLAFLILRDEGHARDAIQETWLSAWRNRNALRNREHADPWIHRILVNACRMALRHQRRHPIVSLNEAEDRAGASAPELSAVQRDTTERLFASLGADDRMLLALHYVQDRPLAEIGNTLGVPEGTVKSRLHRIRKDLSQALKEQDARRA